MFHLFHPGHEVRLLQEAGVRVSSGNDQLNVRAMVRLAVELYDLLYLYPDYPIVEVLDELRRQMR